MELFLLQKKEKFVELFFWKKERSDYREFVKQTQLKFSPPTVLTLVMVPSYVLNRLSVRHKYTFSLQSSP